MGRGDGITYGYLIYPGRGIDLNVIFAQADDGWEHVSVSGRRRCPNWPEMCEIKSLFWDDDDLVLQYHPPKSDYVNTHPHCLHMWRNERLGDPPLPPKGAV